MSDLQVIAQSGFALVNIGLLTGIFFRLGGLTQKHDDMQRRVGRIEEKI